MTAQPAPLRVVLGASVGALDAALWDSLEHEGVPFLKHAFLVALESSGAVGAGTGWTPRPLCLYDGDRLIGAVPLYEKSHSYGEFVFDFAWAHAYHEHGLAYYPKLVAATPFTPARGPRLLVRSGEDPMATRAALADALNAVLEQGHWSSLHVQFATEDDVTSLEPAGFMPRIDCQFLWQNRGYRHFDDFLATFSSEKRKKVLRERRRVREAGITHEWRRGATMSATEWSTVYRLLASTFHRHGHEPYLPLDFFLRASESPATEPRVLLARDSDAIVAAALFFQGSDTLYGRYWGSTEAHHSLHFETCYHQGVEYCIREGLQRFEPGTQGEHKIARGFAPTLTRSAHRIVDPRFAAAIGRYLSAEQASIEEYAATAGAHTPFRRDLLLTEQD